MVLLLIFVPFGFSGALDLRVRPDPEAEYGYEGHARWRVLLTWGGILLRLLLQGSWLTLTARRVTLLGLPLGRKQAKRRPRKRLKPKRRPARPLSRGDLMVYVREGRRLAAQLWRLLRIRVKGDIAFSFDDPALTGMACAALALPPAGSGLRFWPDFGEPYLEGQVEVTGRVLGYQIVGAILAALWRKPIRQRLWRRLRETGGRRR